MDPDSIPLALAILRTTVGRWTALAAAVPPAWMDHPAAPGEWAATGCLFHMLRSEQVVFARRLAATLAGEPFPADADRQRGDRRPSAPPLAEMVAAFAEARAANLRILDTVTDWRLAAVHKHAGPISLAEQVNLWAAHDLEHTQQAERALMQPLIAGCGPFAPAFAAFIFPAARPE